MRMMRKLCGGVSVSLLCIAMFEAIFWAYATHANFTWPQASSPSGDSPAQQVELNFDLLRSSFVDGLAKDDNVDVDGKESTSSQEEAKAYIAREKETFKSFAVAHEKDAKQQQQQQQEKEQREQQRTAGAHHHHKQRPPLTNAEKRQMQLQQEEVKRGQALEEEKTDRRFTISKFLLVDLCVLLFIYGIAFRGQPGASLRRRAPSFAAAAPTTTVPSGFN
ncbi:hypothetical protein QOT17_004752 [Balamuthia mandrillaris]